MGAAVGAAVDELSVRLARRVPGGRFTALGGLVAAGLAARRWAARRERTPGVDGVETAALIVLAGAGAEPGVQALGRAPRLLRLVLAARISRLLLGAAAEAVSLQRRLAEPQDLVKAGVAYDYLPTVSVGDGSAVPLSTLDREGRKFLGLAVPAARIEEVGGKGARAPVRVFVGLETAPGPAERVRVAVAELDRLGAFERSRILVACPTGSGFVHPVPVEAEEYMSGGDVATVAIQYGNQRSYRSLRSVPQGTLTCRLLLDAVAERLRGGPGPELLLYGESLGAWVAAGALAEARVTPARVLLVGPPQGAARLVEELRRTVGVDEGRLTVVIHPEDPVANYSGSALLWRRPGWLPAGERADPRIPRGLRWVPGITFLQVMFDIKNGTSFPVEHGATGHDYRRELPAIVRAALGHADVPLDRLRAVEERVQESARVQAARERAGSGRRTSP